MCGIQRPGQDNLPHDHGTTWVVYGVYEGAIEQTKWRWSYPETDRTSPEIKPLESWVQGPGEIAFFLPGEIHHTRCVAEDRAVVVRLEGQKLAGMLRHRFGTREYCSGIETRSLEIDVLHRRMRLPGIYWGTSISISDPSTRTL